jgi:hypothetical protein
MDIHHAAHNGDLEKVKALLEQNAELVFSKNEFGFTPLHRAAIKGYDNLAKLLLANKANVNAKDNVSCTPLHYATVNGHKSIVELLLANNADVNVKDGNGHTPLQRAEMIHQKTASGRTDFIFAGALLFLGGFLIMLVSYQFAVSRGGGIYLIPFGLMGLGLRMLWKGFKGFFD